MKIATFIIFCVLAAGMAAVYTIFHKEKGYKALLIRGGSVLACFALALVSANLSSILNALPLLVFFGMMFMLLGEAMIVSPIEEEKPKMIVFGVLNSLAIACFGLGALSLTSFNIITLGAGLLLGAGLGCVVCAVKKYKKWYQVLATLLIWVAMGFLVVEGVYACMKSVHMVSAIIIAAGGVMLMASQLIRSFAKDEHKINYIMRVLYILGTAAIAASIFFY